MYVMYTHIDSMEVGLYILVSLNYYLISIIYWDWIM